MGPGLGLGLHLYTGFRGHSPPFLAYRISKNDLKSLRIFALYVFQVRLFSGRVWSSFDAYNLS